MRSLLILALSLLFTSVTPLREVPQIKAANHHHRGRGETIRLPLHHPQGLSSPAPSPSLPFSTVLHHDERRAHFIASRLYSGGSLSVDPSSSSGVSAPLTSGSSLGVGNYVTSLSLGTPPTSYPMVVDTGSSLTWLQCRPCNVSCHDQTVPLFDPSSSSSYSPLPCTSRECASVPSATLNPTACSSAPSKACIYEASYGDGSFSVGVLSRDVLTIGKFVLPGFVFGCGQDNEGLFGKAAGLVGLAKNSLSFLSQAKDKAGAYAFSYCLPTSSALGSLSLGPYSTSRFSFTPMVENSLDGGLYFINLVGVTVAQKKLAVPSSSYNMPTIIDSGTVITRLPSDVYTALSEAVAAAMKRYKQAPPYSILDTCFIGSANNLAAPPVSLVFGGGAEMKLSVKNVLVDVDDETTCLAFAPSGSVVIIGNRQQQTFDVVYDVAEKKIGLAAGGCG